MAQELPTSDTTVITHRKAQKQQMRPPLYRVLLHNDHFTTREFVVDVLRSVFHKAEPEAVQIMLYVHQKGVGVAGVYTYEIAETKVRTVEELAKRREYPLKLTLEPEES